MQITYPPKPSVISQVLYRLRYSDGVTKYQTFKTDEEAQWFINNEGDHLLEARLIASQGKGNPLGS